VALSLSQNYPNPFNPSTTIAYTLEKTAPVTLEIYSILGNKVRTLERKIQTAGSHTVLWDGLDDTGRSVAGGLYIYRLSTGHQVESQKMMLLR
jgi:flagellar hook assembly protein FlgD